MGSLLTEVGRVSCLSLFLVAVSGKSHLRVKGFIWFMVPAIVHHVGGNPGGRNQKQLVTLRSASEGRE